MKPSRGQGNEVRETHDVWARYGKACSLAEQGRFDDSSQIYRTLIGDTAELRPKALAANDLAVLSVMTGRIDEGLEGWRQAIEADKTLLSARLNRDLMNAEIAPGWAEEFSVANGPGFATREANIAEPALPEGPVRLAILSFLFNWPSTGGGNIHTVELASFLARAGYEVGHFHPRFADWQVGHVADGLPLDSKPLDFGESSYIAQMRWEMKTANSMIRRLLGSAPLRRSNSPASSSCGHVA